MVTRTRIPCLAGAALLKGNGTTKYLDPYIFALHYQSVDNAGISMYHLGPAVGGECEWGAFNSGTQVCALYLDYGPTLCIADFWDYNTGGGSGGRIVGTIADFEGFVSSNRTAANAFSLYNANPNKAWGSLGSVILNTGTRPNVRTFIFAYNNGGAAAAYSQKRISFVAYHDGLTSGEGDALYDAVQNLRVALLGGFVPDVLSTGQVVVAFQNQVEAMGVRPFRQVLALRHSTSGMLSSRQVSRTKSYQ